MKKRISFIVILALIMCMSALFACTAEPTYEVGSESLKIWLDRYDEADEVLVKGDKNALTWTSAARVMPKTYIFTTKTAIE